MRIEDKTFRGLYERLDGSYEQVVRIVRAEKFIERYIGIFSGSDTTERLRAQIAAFSGRIMFWESRFFCSAKVLFDKKPVPL